MISVPDPRGGDGRKPGAPQPDRGPARGSEPWRVRCVVRGTGHPVAMTLDFAGGVTATSLAMGRIAIRVPGVGMSLPSDRHASMFGACGEGAKRPRLPRSDCGDIPGREAWHPSAHSKGTSHPQRHYSLAPMKLGDPASHLREPEPNARQARRRGGNRHHQQYRSDAKGVDHALRSDGRRPGGGCADRAPRRRRRNERHRGGREPYGGREARRG